MGSWARGAGGRVGAAVGVSVQVFMVLSKDKVLQRFVEQIIVDDKVVDKVQQRFEK